MTSSIGNSASEPFAVYNTGGVFPAAGPRNMAIAEHIGAKTGATLAAGQVTFTDIDTGPFKLWYDEVLFLHATTGSFELEYDGKVHPLAVGDAAWIRAGSTVVYRSTGSSMLFYAVTPADWTHRGDLPG